MILNWLKQKFPDHFCDIRVVSIAGKSYKAVIDDRELSGDICYSYGRTKAKLLHDYCTVDEPNYYAHIPPIFKEELIYYISFIQDKFDRITTHCKKGVYFREDLGIVLRLQINPIKYEATYTYPPADAFLLVKWFTEIQDTQKVPEDLEEYITKEMALEILEG
jgi:hypothetical protein